MPPRPDQRDPTPARQWHHDAEAALAEITAHLRDIAQDRLDDDARRHLAVALQQGETLSRLIADAVAHEADDAAPDEGARTGALAGKRILVAAASDGAAPLAAALGAEGAEVECLDTGTEARAAVVHSRYDLVVVDAAMSGGTGAQVIEALRAQPGAAGQTPALAMSTSGTVQCHDMLIGAGADRVVTKPLPAPAELVRIAGRMLRAEPRAHEPVPDAAPAPAPAEPAEIPLFDPEPLLRVCALAGAEMAEEIVERLMADLTETGERMRRAANPPDFTELRAASHVLIALAGTAGAMQLLDRTQQLNRLLHAEVPEGFGPILAEVGLLTEGAIEAIRRLPPLPPEEEAAP